MESIYEKRPWLDIYPEDLDADLAVRRRSALDVFRETASAYPQRPGLYYFDRTLTYYELDSLSDALALALIDMGVQNGDRVALYMQNVPQFAISQYAAWKTGATVVPLNPMFKEKELLYYFEDSGAKILVCLESGYHEVVRSILKKTPLQGVITTS